MLQFINHAVTFLYPNTCGICGIITQEGLCKKCEIKFDNEIFMKIDNYKCDNTKYFDEHIYFSKYNGIIRKRIIDYKFNGQAYLEKFFSNIILKNEKIYVHLKKYDIIIPVPIHKKRKQVRGYNQSELFAKTIAQKLELQINNNILLKEKNNVPQSSLNKDERIKNAKGIYKVQNSIRIDPKNVLLVDDVYTTGSTVNECARVLKKIGIKYIGVLTIAKD